MAWDQNFSYFCDNWRKTEFLAPRSSPHKAESFSFCFSFSFQFQQKNFYKCAGFADKFVSIQCRLIVFGDCLLADCSRIQLLNSGMACLFSFVKLQS